MSDNATRSNSFFRKPLSYVSVFSFSFFLCVCVIILAMLWHFHGKELQGQFFFAKDCAIMRGEVHEGSWGFSSFLVTSADPHTVSKWPVFISNPSDALDHDCCYIIITDHAYTALHPYYSTMQILYFVVSCCFSPVWGCDVKIDQSMRILSRIVLTVHTCSHFEHFLRNRPFLIMEIKFNK